MPEFLRGEWQFLKQQDLFSCYHQLTRLLFSDELCYYYNELTEWIELYEDCVRHNYSQANPKSLHHKYEEFQLFYQMVR